MELSFEVFCGKCLKNIPTQCGIVLSCGDFLCDKCAHLSKSGCPSCGTRDINAVLLDNPPPEVTSMLNNPASELQDLFDILKFQIRHYKSSLVRARSLLKDSELERRHLAEYVTVDHVPVKIMRMIQEIGITVCGPKRWSRARQHV